MTKENMPNFHIRKNSYAFYEVFSNTIYLNIDKMKIQKKDFNAYIIKHELEHAFNSRILDGVMYIGFSKYYLDKKSNMNLDCSFLNEGFAHLLHIPTLSENTKFKNLKYLLTNQLSLIIGIDTIKEAYYNNLGLNPLKEELVSQGNDLSRVDVFFTEFLKLKENMNYDNQFSSLEFVESMLLEFCDNKLKLLSTISEKRMLLEKFKEFIPNNNYMKDRKLTWEERKESKVYDEINNIYNVKLDDRVKKLHKVG